MYPLDVVKTRFQLQVTNGQSTHAHYTSIMDCFKRIIQEEGLWRLYRGILPPILVEAPKRAIKFSANEQYSKLYKKVFGYQQMTQPLSILTGVSAGMTEAFVVVSSDLVKIRLQDKHNTGRYKSTLDCVVKICREEGPLTFFRGLEATMWRHAAWNGGYFGVIHGVKKALPPGDTPQGALLNNILAGTIGGTVGTILNTPFDVAKTRIQNHISSAGLRPKYVWALPSAKLIFQEEGFSALYKGFVPKVLRLGPGGGILLVVFDSVSDWLKKNVL
uniref:Uncharacterized protein n=1 Tax=Arcella intermedia TaxID=1963864 RepID=A0A6B2LBQ3_9EUKA